MQEKEIMMKKSTDLGEFLRPKPDKNLNEWGYEIVEDKEVFTVKLKTQVRKQNSNSSSTLDYLPRIPVQTFL